MNPAQALDLLADGFGILPRYFDLNGCEQPTSRDTKLALLRANGLELDNEAMVLDALHCHRAKEAARQFPREIVAQSGQNLKVNAPDGAEWQLLPEGVSKLAAMGRATGQIALPPMDSGIHKLLIQTAVGAETINLIASPAIAPTLEQISDRARVWGVNAALYGLRSERNLGLGDFEDLACAAETAAEYGASFLGINPIHSLGWSDRQTISPYSPSHRGFLNTAHIAIDRISSLELSVSAQNLIDSSRAHIAHAMASDTVEYAHHASMHRRLLRSLFQLFKTEAVACAFDAFEAFRTAHGAALAEFALYESLSEDHGPDWRRWPKYLQTPQAAAKRLNGDALADRLQFHSWLQWVANDQLAEAQSRARGAGMSLGLYLDLAVGPRRGAAETWCETTSIAPGVSIGAPPDELSPAGQNWDLAAYSPTQLSASRYQAFRQILRETMRHSSVLRIDHILGLNRSYWIPDDGSPGGYIKQPLDSLLAVIALEAERTQTVVVGEDLGLVPEGFGETINGRGIYSYSVLQYDKDKPRKFQPSERRRKQSLLCFGTHDTPTLKGFWKGCDIDWWQRLGWIDAQRAIEIRDRRGSKIRGLMSPDQTEVGQCQEHEVPETYGYPDISERVHSTLAGSDAAMVSVQLDDIFGQSGAQNLPGTIDEHPNWRRRSKMSIEAFKQNASFQKIGLLMTNNGRGPPVDQIKDETK